MPLTRTDFLHAAAGASFSLAGAAAPRPMAKIKDLIIYKDERFYSAFPSIVRRPSGDLIVAFRRAPDRRRVGAKGVTHTDPNSNLVLVRSRDSGETWTRQPELIHAHPEAGSQDPCMVQLRDGTLVCASYAWYWIPPSAQMPEKQQAPHKFLGGYIVRSIDGGKTWQGPYIPPPVPGRNLKDPFGQPLPSYNRGAMCQGRDGRLYWVVAYGWEKLYPSDLHLLISADGGRTWKYSCPVASDQKVEFNETSLYETPKGDLVAFIRTANFDDHTVIARSTDGGKSFQPWQDAGFQGHPHHALRLPDNRVWLAFGYRHKPFGIRARILDAECTNASTAPEIVLRDDGGSGDLGYPWSAPLPGGHILTVYYFNTDHGGPRWIAGTICG
jgi:sialidase-1